MILIPYRDHNRPTRIPIVMPLIVAVNVGVFLYQTYLGFISGGDVNGFVSRMGAVPEEITDIRHWRVETLWSPITSLFTHGGIIHLAFNMLYLWVFGDDVEDRMGRFQFLFFYLVCGLGAVLLHVIIYPKSGTPLVGASGAIFGVMAAYAIMFPGTRLQCAFFLCVIPIVVHLPALLVIAYYLVIQILSARVALIDPHGETIAWFAHLGGFLTGVFYVHRMKRFIRPPGRGSRFA